VRTPATDRKTLVSNSSGIAPVPIRSCSTLADCLADPGPIGGSLTTFGANRKSLELPSKKVPVGLPKGVFLFVGSAGGIVTTREFFRPCTVIEGADPGQARQFPRRHAHQSLGASNEEQVRGGKRMGNNLEFAGKVALIAGGNSGIGAAAVKRVAELGAQVVVTGRRLSEGRLLGPVNTIRTTATGADFSGF
jgi:hypothetical protein